MGKICCFTGHRKISDNYILRLPDALDTLLDKLIDKGVDTFRAGGAIGFDTLCALMVLEKKKSHPSIKLELCLPCHDQTKSWGKQDVAIYDYIIRHATDVRYAEERYTSDCMFKRNRMLVDGADICVAFCATSTGGTAYTLSYAAKQGVKTINLFDKFTET